MSTRAIYSAVCPCCACTLVELVGQKAIISGITVERACIPLRWCCVHCGFALMGLAVPVRPETYQDPARQYSCMDVRDTTECWTPPRPRCGLCGRFTRLVEGAPEGESGDIYACAFCDLNPPDRD